MSQFKTLHFCNHENQMNKACKTRTVVIRVSYGCLWFHYYRPNKRYR